PNPTDLRAGKLAQTLEAAEASTNEPQPHQQQQPLLPQLQPPPPQRPESYIRRYLGFENCGDPGCRSACVREHYHCGDCRRPLGRREEMIRHVKWHKKRAESLALGFLRYSPADQCGSSTCSFNGRQTHYHCAHRGCAKVYISTSDVQIHANYHRKDAAIIRQGFQRFRATEECPDSTCQYQKERTTHFHCLRPNCSFTFKNKTDMEKHRGHHARNDQFARDGFRKYMKYETCEFADCKFSRLMNHIHCIREGCDFVVHSSSQILSHCRKHERRGRDDSGSAAAAAASGSSAADFNNAQDAAVEEHQEDDDVSGDDSRYAIVADRATLAELEASRAAVRAKLEAADKDQLLLGHCKRFTANDPCQARCELLFKDHQHCLLCPATFRSKERARDHARLHFLDGEFAAALFYRHQPEEACPHCSDSGSVHLHCRYCLARPSADGEAEQAAAPPLACLNHVRCHEAVQLPPPIPPTSKADQQQAAAAAPRLEWQQRRRGRPPKSASLTTSSSVSIAAQPQPPQLEASPEALFDDGSLALLRREHFLAASSGGRPICGFRMAGAADSPEACGQGDSGCPFADSSNVVEHFHCVRPRCNWASDSLAELNEHRRSFHGQLGSFRQASSISHPGSPAAGRVASAAAPPAIFTAPRCGYVFVRPTTMAAHLAKHEAANASLPALPPPPPPLPPLLQYPSQPLLYSADCPCGRPACPLSERTHAHCSHPDCDGAFADAQQLRTAAATAAAAAAAASAAPTEASDEAEVNDSGRDAKELGNFSLCHGGIGDGYGLDGGFEEASVVPATNLNHVAGPGRHSVRVLRHDKGAIEVEIAVPFRPAHSNVDPTFRIHRKHIGSYKCFWNTVVQQSWIVEFPQMRTPSSQIITLAGLHERLDSRLPLQPQQPGEGAPVHYVSHILGRRVRRRPVELGSVLSPVHVLAVQPVVAGLGLAHEVVEPAAASCQPHSHKVRTDRLGAVRQRREAVHAAPAVARRLGRVAGLNVPAHRLVAEEAARSGALIPLRNQVSGTGARLHHAGRHTGRLPAALSDGLVEAAVAEFAPLRPAAGGDGCNHEAQTVAMERLKFSRFDDLELSHSSDSSSNRSADQRLGDGQQEGWRRTSTQSAASSSASQGGSVSFSDSSAEEKKLREFGIDCLSLRAVNLGYRQNTCLQSVEEIGGLVRFRSQPFICEVLLQLDKCGEWLSDTWTLGAAQQVRVSPACTLESCCQPSPFVTHTNALIEVDKNTVLADQCQLLSYNCVFTPYSQIDVALTSRRHYLTRVSFRHSCTTWLVAVRRGTHTERHYHQRIKYLTFNPTWDRLYSLMTMRWDCAFQADLDYRRGGDTVVMFNESGADSPSICERPLPVFRSVLLGPALVDTQATVCYLDNTGQPAQLRQPPKYITVPWGIWQRQMQRDNSGLLLFGCQQDWEPRTWPIQQPNSLIGHHPEVLVESLGDNNRDSIFT
uniref:C2H2-type domain-containing protein n=1 Tax=Macrostomum lignano TaxID=282301 RepID=A0A1I8FSK8_9PLAT